MHSIIEVLDLAKSVQNVRSDYKLSLTVGIGESSLSAYRKGQNLPDEINCKKLALAGGLDPALLVVEMQAQRAKSQEAREIWITIAKRLQAGFASTKMLLLIAMVSVAASLIPAMASVYAVSLFAHINSLYIVEYVRRRKARFKAAIVKLCKVTRFFNIRVFLLCF